MKTVKISRNCLTAFLGAGLFMAAPVLFAQNVFLELNLTGPRSHGFAYVQSESNLDILRTIQRAGDDSRIGGIVLNVSAYSAGHETLWELRQELEGFKAKGKKVVAFVSNADLNLYYLASVADKIVMDDQGSLMLLGYAWGRGYVRQGLEKLGVGVRELRYFEYKSAVETFTRDSMSDADRRQYGQWLADSMSVTRNAVMQSRNLTGEEFDSVINSEFLFSPGSALERGLVDALGRWQAVNDAVKELSGNSANSFTVFGDTASSLSGSGRSYGPGRSGGFFSRPPVIAVINASGATDMERGMAAGTLSRTIEEISRRNRVKAIVLRIDSGGGSAEAADYIAGAVQNARKRVPVVVSMGSVAASGGYWAGMTADYIMATPVTMTGSIGVISTWFFDNGLNDKLGISVDTMQIGSHADLMSGIILPTRDLNPAEEERFRLYILDSYNDFVSRVAQNRGMEISQVEEVAQGRVFSGLGALDAGLIDSIGGLSDAVNKAKELAGIAADRKVAFEEYPRPTFLEKMLARLTRMGMQTQTAVLPNTQAALLMTDLFLPMHALEDIRFRLNNNGRVMPILPVDFGNR